MLYLNGVYDANGYFWPVKPPTCDDLDVIAHTIATRVSRFLEKAGYLVGDAESEYLDLMQDEEDAMGAIVGASITYRLAFGPHAGRKALTLQTVPVRTESRKGDDLVSKQAGFSLHAGRSLLVPPTRAPPATLSLFAASEFQTPHQQRRH